MKVRSTLFLATLLIAAPFAQGSLLEPGDVGASSNFSLVRQTQVPGEVLKPGDYSIQIIEHISDRMIVRIDSVQGKEHFLFLGVPSLEANSTGATGVQTWRTGAGSLPAMRGFNFATGTAVDFVYPKADAAALAKANAATIIAIDPASEGRPTKLNNLSSDDMREINLWMLTLTSTGPADHVVPALEAKRYQAPPPTQFALDAAVPSRPESRTRPAAGSSAPQTQLAKLDQPAAPERTTSRSKAVGAELPHTASLMPVIWLFGCFSFFFAALSIGVRKLSGSSATLNS